MTSIGSRPAAPALVSLPPMPPPSPFDDESSLDAQTAALADQLRTADGLIVALDDAGIVRATSLATETTTGLSPDQLVGRALTDLVPEEDCAALAELMATDPPVADLVSRVCHSDGSLRAVEFSFQWRSSAHALRIVKVRDLEFLARLGRELSDRRALDSLVPQIAGTLLGLRPDRIDAGVDAALESLGVFCDADSAWLFQLDADSVHCTNTWLAPDSKLNPVSLTRLGSDATTYQWWKDRTRDAGSGVMSETDIRSLPPDSGLDTSAPRSFLSAPIDVAGRRLGFLGVNGDARTDPWPPHMADAVAAVAQLVGQALLAARATDELARSEQQFRSAIECLLDPVIIFEPVFDASVVIDFDITYANPAAHGIDSRLACASSCRLLELYPLSRDIFFDDWVAVHQTREPRITHASWYDEEPVAGSYIAQAVPFGSGVLVTLRNLTEQALAERSRAEEEERYRHLVELSPDAIIVHDGKVALFANAAAGALVGTDDVTAEIGNSILSYVHPDSVVETLQRISSLEREGDSTGASETVIVRSNGEVRYVESIAVKTRWNGAVAFQVIMRDQTERRLAERELERRMAFDRLLVEISQELTGQSGADLEQRLNPVLARIGSHVDASRVLLRRPVLPGQSLAWDWPEPLPEVSYADLAGPARTLATPDTTALFGPDAASAMLVPLEQAGTRLGMVAFVATHEFTPADLEQMAPFAALLASTIARDDAVRTVVESEDRLRGVLGHLPVMIGVVDPDGVIVFAEGSALAAIGSDPADLLGTRLIEHTTLEDTTGLHGLFLSALDGQEGSCEIHLAGRIFDVLCSPLRNTDGQITSVLTVGNDVTDFRQTEAALRESVETFRTAFSSSPLGVCLTDRDGVFLAVNDAFREMTGYTPGRSEDRFWTTFADRDGLDSPPTLGPDTLAHPGAIVTFTARFERDGTARLVETYLAAITDECGEVVSFIGQCRDVTESRRAEIEIHVLNEELAARVGELDATQQELRLVLADLDQAREQERRRVAMVLHDDTVQALVGTRVFVEQLHDLLNQPDEFQQVAHYAQVALDASLTSLRRMIADLWPPVLSHNGLGAAVEALLVEVESDGLTVDLVDRLPGRLDPELEAVAFRTIQEGVRNILRHAHASRIRVLLCTNATHLLVEVNDDGVGIKESELARRTSHGHIGVVSMRETIHAAGGSFELTRRSSGGTRLAFMLPLEHDDRRALLPATPPP